MYIWGLAEEVEPRAPGERRDQRSLLPLAHPQDSKLNWLPSAPLRTPPPFSLESRFRRAESAERAAESAHCLAVASPVSARLPRPAQRRSARLCDPPPGGRRRARGESCELQRKRGRTLENVEDFS